MHASMLPPDPEIIACPHCQHVGWLRDFAVIDIQESYAGTWRSPAGKAEHPSQRRQDRYPRAAPGQQPSCEALCAFANANAMDAKQATRTRLNAWQSGNDARHDATQPAPPLQNHEIHNLHCLLPIMEGGLNSEVQHHWLIFNEW